jgi:hypothetical protein
VRDLAEVVLGKEARELLPGGIVFPRGVRGLRAAAGVLGGLVIRVVQRVRAERVRAERVGGGRGGEEVGLLAELAQRRPLEKIAQLRDQLLALVKGRAPLLDARARWRQRGGRSVTDVTAALGLSPSMTDS